MTEKQYRVNEVFYSLQGEGLRAGSANFFLRLSGCNETCVLETHGFDCDTEFTSGRWMTIDLIIEELRLLSKDCKWIVITGGEPGLQVDASMIERLHTAGYSLAVETNGSIELPAGLDWITVSPKVAEHAVRQRKASEVKYVRGHGQGIPKTAVTADHYLLSPAFNGMHIDSRALQWCIELVKENPKWKLSVQLHKLWSIR